VRGWLLLRQQLLLPLRQLWLRIIAFFSLGRYRESSTVPIPAFEVDELLGPPVDRKHAGITVPSGIEPGIEAHPGRGADGAAIDTIKLHSFRGQLVKLKCSFVRVSVGSEYFVVQVIGKEKEDVGLLGGLECSASECSEEKY
jgi:hypothetical protein